MTGNKINYDVIFVCINDISTDARTLNIAKLLAENNYSVAIIASSESESIKILAENGIRLIAIPPSKEQKAFKRWKHFNKHIKAIIPEIKSRITWASDLYSLYAAGKLSKKNGSKLFYDSREIYSAIGALHSRPLKQKTITYFEKKWIKRVDRIIVSGPMDAEYLKNTLSNKHPYDVIMNLPPYSEKQDSNLIREKYNIPDKATILLYQGVLLEGRGIFPIIKALPLMKDTVFFLIGDGPYKNQISEFAEKTVVAGSVILHGAVPYGELNQWTSSADIGVVMNEPISFSYKMALPNKLFEYCIAGIPSLVSNLPAQKQVLDEFAIGELIEPDAPPEEIASAIDKLKNKNQYSEQMKKAARHYSYENQEPEILKIFES